MILTVLKKWYGRKMVTGKLGEGCIEERVCSSLPIRAGVLITAVGMGREVESPRMRGIESKHAAARKNGDGYCAKGMFEHMEDRYYITHN